jgi:hypothetical protein
MALTQHQCLQAHSRMPGPFLLNMAGSGTAPASVGGPVVILPFDRQDHPKPNDVVTASSITFSSNLSTIGKNPARRRRILRNPGIRHRRIPPCRRPPHPERVTQLRQAARPRSLGVRRGRNTAPQRHRTAAVPAPGESRQSQVAHHQWRGNDRFSPSLFIAPSWSASSPVRTAKQQAHIRQFCVHEGHYCGRSVRSLSVDIQRESDQYLYGVNTVLLCSPV